MPSTPRKKVVITRPRLADRGRKLGYAPGVLAWSLWVLSVAFETGAGVVITRKSNFYSPPDYFDLLLALSFLPLGAVGALVAMKRSASIIGWLFCFANVAVSLWVAGEVYTSYLSYPLAHRDLVSAAVTVAGDLVMLALACSLFLFPEDRVQAVAPQPVGWVLGAGVAGYVLTQVLHTGSLVSLLTAAGIRIPRGGPAGEIFYQHILALPVGQALIILILGLALLSGLVRLRRARGVERQQLKWFAFAAILPVAGLADLLLINWAVGAVLTGAGVSALAAAVGLAIVRHRLYDIDVIINRTLVYGTVTAMLAGLFAGLSILTQRLVLALTGQESQAAVVLAALAVTALFQPLRARVQILVDRRFYRRKYDATRTLERFALRLREEVELDRLVDGLMAVVQETMQPTHVSLWLRPSAPTDTSGGKAQLATGD